MLDQHHRHGVSGAQTRDHGRQLLDHDRRQALERLVHEQHRGVADQGAGDRQHLLLATGEGLPQVPGAPTQTRKELEGPGHGPGAGPARHGKVVLHRQRRKDLPLLGYPAESRKGAPMGLPEADVAALEQDRAVPHAGMTHDGRKQRRLADPVAAEHGNALARADAQIERVEHHRRAIAGAQAPDLQRRGLLSHGAGGQDRRRARGYRRRSPHACPRSGWRRRPSP